MQYIYGRKTEQSLPIYTFSDSFCLSVYEKHYSNKKESLKFFNKVIIPYIKKVCSSQNITSDRCALVIMDVFTGKTTSDVLNLLRDDNILLIKASPNMTKFYQTLDLTVNRFSKRFIARKFNDWCTEQESAQLEKGVNINEII